MPLALQTSNELLSIQGLQAQIGQDFYLRGINLEVGRGQRVGLVGESGSGKSSLALLILQLVPFVRALKGEILFEGSNLLALKPHAIKALRGAQISYIAQEPLSALNPLHQIQKQILEALYLHAKPTKQEAHAKLEAVMAQVGLSMDLCQRYPYELSGGQNQRVALAMALINRPKLLICDEPTTALDAQIQQQILDLLVSLSVQNDMAILLISHDLGAIRHVAQHVYVLQEGQICEQASTPQLFNTPQHPYTQMLLQARHLSKKNSPPQPQEVMSVKDFGVRYVKKKFWGKNSYLQAIQGVGFALHAKETLGVIGESGSGKSSLAMGLLKLAPIQGQQILLQQSVQALSPKAFKPFRRSLQMVFQNPFASLNPRWSVQEILLEAFYGAGIKASSDQVRASLEAVGLEPKFLDYYPFELSGGQRQRVAIARAILSKPQVVVMDEPTSALDKSMQKVVLNLLLELQEKRNLSYVFISHDLAVIECMCDSVLVVQKGQVVESGSLDQVFSHPKHPYTQQLLATRLT
ncbi:dipeptide ABC transporter ATP-binding protein [Helicobacter bizzozeronii]|uniref:dipeptide ABC transporter ATP-binding protein n=1 Tax=Helicobacter bizzozeronii TaxID=56877 RepID=UPI0005A1B832|nr:ABC transporter ATP-binding protein [Helicobacter bizzozeronii]